jgi:predicted RNase H-like nuclease (RuvC/YqgF family)
MSDNHNSMSEQEPEVGISMEQSVEESMDIGQLPDDPEQLIKMMEQCEARYQLLEHENNKLGQKYDDVSKQITSQKEASKQQLLQAETMGMMTKYQLVFVKMETAFSKIFNRNKLRDLKKLQDAFAQFKFNTVKNRVEINCASRVAFENLKNSGKFVRFYEKNARYNLKEAFQNWKRNIIVDRAIMKKKEELDFELDNTVDERKRVERRINELEEEIEENDKRYNHLYALVKDNKNKITLYENKGRELSNDINQIIDKDPNTRVDIGGIPSSQNKIQALQMRLSEAMNENNELNASMEMTNTNVKSFISEMGVLISNHEVCQLVEPITDGPDMFDDQYRNSNRRVQQS